MTRAIAFFAAAAVMLGLALGFFLVARNADSDAFAECRRGPAGGGAAPLGGPFTLTNGAGERVTEAQVVTKPTLLYFGYASCPDVCPMDMARNAAAADLLAGRGLAVGQVFVSIDPERDTPEAAAAFAAAVHPEAVGLSGAPEDVAAAANAYRVYWRKAGDDPETYAMDHSSLTYLAAPGHPFLAFYPSDASAAQVAESVACYAAAL